MGKHKMKTAAAMGMLKLYSIGTTRIYKKENRYFIRANSKDEAQKRWSKYRDDCFIDPVTPLPNGFTYKHTMYREPDYDYDYDNSLEEVDEEKYDENFKWHREALDELYKDK